MRVSDLVSLVEAVRATVKKNEKVALLARVLRDARGRDAELLASYLSGTAPQGRIGIGWRTIESATPPEPGTGGELTLADVDAMMDALASDQGPGSMERKVTRIRRLFERADRREHRFLVQLLLGEVRQGAEEGLILEAVAKAAVLPIADVRQAMMFSGNVGAVARLSLDEGAPGLAGIGFQLLRPIAPMLANTAEDPTEALERLGEVAFEFKLDGARIQVHKQGDEIRVFTRQLQDVTGRLPELVEWTRALPASDVVLEGEAIALRPDGRPQPFQTTMSRFGRIKEVAAARRAIPLASFFFDCLYKDGEGPLLRRPYRERTAILAAAVPGTALIPRLVTADREEAQRFLLASFEAGHEGLMAKSLTAPYIAGQRGSHWLKVKAAKTLDLVVLAAEWGNGRRSGWLSNLHLGARDARSGNFIMLGKTFKGLTDEILHRQTEQLLALEERREGVTVYVRPKLVVEIAFSDVQQSPRYPAGLALRFARVKRYRPDKTAEEADTIQSVEELFRKSRL
jgi:DNA ligase-1